MSLTALQDKFCLNYWATGNGTQSAIDAGYSKRTAASQATRLLKNVKIKNRIKELEEQSRVELQQQFSRDAIKAREIMFDIMQDELAPENVRLSAAKDFMDRAGYKPTDDMNIHTTGDMGIKVEWLDE